MEQGFVKLWRKSKTSQIFADPYLWKLFCLCLLKTNHEKKYVSIHGLLEPVLVNPGQFVTGRFALHKEYYPRRSKRNKSPLTLWRWMEVLQTMQILNINTNNKYSVVTILNWEEYQDNMNNKMNSRRTTGEQQVNTNKNYKNYKNDKNKDSAREWWDYYITTTGKRYKYTDEQKNLINKRIREKYTLDQFKLALNNFINDDWDGRARHMELRYCIGTISGINKFDHWLDGKAKIQGSEYSDQFER